MVLASRRKEADLPGAPPGSNPFMSQPDWKTIQVELNQLRPNLCSDEMAKNLAKIIPEAKLNSFMESMKNIISLMVKNITGYGAEFAFGSFESLLSNPSFKPEYLETAKLMAKRASGDNFPIAVYALNQFISNPGFKPEHLQLLNPTFQLISKNITGFEAGGAYLSLHRLISRSDFKPEHLELFQSSVQFIIKNTTGFDTSLAFDKLDSLISNPNFNYETDVGALQLMLKTSHSNISDLLEYLFSGANSSLFLGKKGETANLVNQFFSKLRTNYILETRTFQDYLVEKIKGAANRAITFAEFSDEVTKLERSQECTALFKTINAVGTREYRGLIFPGVYFGKETPFWLPAGKWEEHAEMRDETVSAVKVASRLTGMPSEFIAACLAHEGYLFHLVGKPNGLYSYHSLGADTFYEKFASGRLTNWLTKGYSEGKNFTDPGTLLNEKTEEVKSVAFKTRTDMIIGFAALLRSYWVGKPPSGERLSEQQACLTYGNYNAGHNPSADRVKLAINHQEKEGLSLVTTNMRMVADTYFYLCSLKLFE